MKLGSSRGTDTRRPRGSERSKPRHKLRLTRPSQRPYPGPPEQAQPGVSEPCRTTPFVANLRIQWLDLMRSLQTAEPKPGAPELDQPTQDERPVVIQLLGDRDDFVSSEDQRDVTV